MLFRIARNCVFLNRRLMSSTIASAVDLNIVIVAMESTSAIGLNVQHDYHSNFSNKLPSNAKISKIITNSSDIDIFTKDSLIADCNVLCLVKGDRKVLNNLISAMPRLMWCHCCLAGLDSLMCPALVESKAVVTNAKGVYSDSLAEYVMAAILYFNKNIPLLLQQQKEHKWNRFSMNQLYGKTLGVIGYGNIGQRCASYAKSFGMNIIGIRRNSQLSKDDPLVDKVS